MPIEECRELDRVNWEWQSADCSMGKAGFGGEGAIGRNPTDRSKAGSKKIILVDGSGGSLSAVVAGANVHDTKLLRLKLESIAARRTEGAQNLCLDTCAWTRGRQSHQPRNRLRHRIPAPYRPYWRREIGPVGEETHPALGWVADLTNSTHQLLASL